jgi:phospholipid/cholesterol/gamma-HCH transport system substrate-binding protein
MELNKSRKTSSFMIGLFVVVGTSIAFVFIVWLGASKYFEKGLTYVTYFDESVQGLQADSSVKYRGVDIGRVLKIGVAPDNSLVEVVIKINDPNRVEADVLSQLKTVGITGIVFIELDRRRKGENVLGKKLQFEPPYPVILSRPSDISQIMSGVADIYQKIQKIDFEGISNHVKSTAKSIDIFFNNEKMNNTMKHIEAATASLESTTQRIDKMVAEGKVDKTLQEAQQTLAQIRHEIDAMRLGDTAGKATRFLDHLDQRTLRVSNHMEDTLMEIKSNSENLNRLLERLQNNPSALIFGGPAPYDRVGERK